MNRSNWQTELSTIRERTKYAFNKFLFCDVEFSVEDLNGLKVTIPANKYILAVSSPVFEAMFYGKLAESKPTIELPDCTSEGLYELLRYVYSDEVNLTGSNVMEVMYLAEKYMMPFLNEKCKNYLHNEVGPDDVLSVIPDIQKPGDEKLKKHMWNIVECETHLTVSSKSFLNVSRELLCEILVRDTLTINELDLFRAVDRWAEKIIKEQGLERNGKTKRSILGEEVIRLIRYPLMMQKEFAEVVLPLKILSEDELIELFKNFSKVPSIMFGEKKRCLDGLLIPSVRFGSIKSPDGYSGNKVNAIDFFTDEIVYLVGICLFGKRDTKYDVELNINKGSEMVSRLSSSFVTESNKIDDLYYGFTVNLDQAVKLHPNIVYTINAIIDGPPTYYGVSGKDVVAVENGITITYKTSSSYGSRTSVSTGQFPTLILRRF